MVGALADWFAVTALFRHPLGIPIPHTAIIPKRKDQIGRSLGEFVAGQLPHPRGADRNGSPASHVGRRLGRWLRRAGARRAGGRGDRRRHARHDRGARRPRRAGGASAGSSSGGCGRPTVAPLLGKAIDVAVEGGHHQRLLDAVLDAASAAFLDDNRAHVARPARRRSRRGGCPSRSTTASSRRSSAACSASSPTSRDEPDHEVRRVDRGAHPSRSPTGCATTRR